MKDNFRKVNLILTDELHSKLKIKGIKEGKHLYTVINEILTQGVK